MEPTGKRRKCVPGTCHPMSRSPICLEESRCGSGYYVPQFLYLLCWRSQYPAVQWRLEAEKEPVPGFEGGVQNMNAVRHMIDVNALHKPVKFNICKQIERLVTMNAAVQTSFFPQTAALPSPPASQQRRTRLGEQESSLKGLREKMLLGQQHSQQRKQRPHLFL